MTTTDVMRANLVEMDTTEELVVLGDDVKRTFTLLMTLLYTAPVALALVGPPGSGKSHVGSAMAREYAKMKGCKAYFIQGDQELTKSSAVGGLRMVQGTTVPFLSTIAVAMEEGAVVFFDELTHAYEQIQTALNTALDRNARTAVGHHMVTAHPDFRVIIASNNMAYAGNSAYVPSFAGRLIVYPFGYPNTETEARIAKRITQEMLRGSDYAKIERAMVNGSDGNEKAIDRVVLPVPNAVIRHTAAMFKEIREKNAMLPTSARNMANFLYCLALYPKDDKQPLATELVSGAHADPKQRKIAERIFWKTNVTPQEMRSTDVVTFMQYVSSFVGGLDTYRQLVYSNCGIHLDIKGISTTSMNKLRTEITGMVV